MTTPSRTALGKALGRTSLMAIRPLITSYQTNTYFYHRYSTQERSAITTAVETNKARENMANEASPEPTRFAGPPEDEMTDEQRQIQQEILASRPGTGLSGPFGPWLAVPGIARPAQSLGKACRYGTSLSFRESELVILLTGAKFKSNTEFQIHTGEALKAGISQETINAIPREESGSSFSMEAVQQTLMPMLSEEREKAIVLFTTELLETNHVSDETYAATKEALEGKDSVLVEITSIVGYYAFVSYTLNVFRISP